MVKIKNNPAEFIIAQSAITFRQMQCLPLSLCINSFIYIHIYICMYVCINVHVCVFIMKMLHSPNHLFSKMERYQEDHTGGVIIMVWGGGEGRRGLL